MITPLLTLYYGLIAALLAGVTLAAGTSLRGPLRLPQENRLLDLLQNFTIGLAAICFLSAVLGNVGLLRTEILLALLLLLMVIGRKHLLIACLYRPVRPKGWTPLATIILSLLFLNIFIGALVPDLGHDAMWYHLPVPQQWMYFGGLRALPDVMPSAYPLGFNIVYTLLLRSGDVILCTLYYMLVVITLLLMCCAWAGKLYGPRAAAFVALIFVPIYAVRVAMAPMASGNDAGAALFLLTAATLLFTGESARPLPIVALAGFLAGMALSAKLIMVLFLPGLFFLAILGRPPREVVYTLVIFGSGIVAGYSPWAIRGFVEVGNPVFPLAGGIFPPKEAFLRAYEESQALNNSYPLSIHGLKESLTDGLPARISMALTTADVGLFFVLVVTLLALLAGDRTCRIIAITIILNGSGLILMKGANEVLRYFSLGFPLAAPLIAGLLLRAEDHLSRQRFRLVVTIISLMAVASYARTQWRFASFSTVQWRFLPVLSEKAIDRYTSIAEKGGAYRVMEDIRDSIPTDATVLFVGETYPFYLWRRAIWNDESMRERGLTARWREGGWQTILAENAVTHVLILGNDDALYTVAGEAEAVGHISRLATGTSNNQSWSVYTINAEGPVLPGDL